MTRKTDDEGFLARLSRRKREGDEDRAAREAETQDGDALADEALSDEASMGENPELAANRSAAEAVDLESLTYDSDFTVFMKEGVPAALKNAALQKLWRSNPVLAVLDGLNDYDEDYRLVENVAGQFQSAWKVGKGYADKAEEVAKEMEARSAALARAREEAATAHQADTTESINEPDAMDAGQKASANTRDLPPAAENDKMLGRPELALETGDEKDKAPLRVSIRRRMNFEIDEDR